MLTSADITCKEGSFRPTGLATEVENGARPDICTIPALVATERHRSYFCLRLSVSLLLLYTHLHSRSFVT